MTLFPKTENKGMKDANQPRLEELRRQSYPGMAHWAGTGPEGTRCLTCMHADFKGYKQGIEGSLKPINCKKYFAVMKKKGPVFDPHAKSCRFYIEGSGPPKR